MHSCSGTFPFLFRKYLYKKCSVHLCFSRFGGGRGGGVKMLARVILNKHYFCQKSARQCAFDKGGCGQKLFGQFLQRNFPLSAIGNMVHRQQRAESLSITCFSNNWSTTDFIPLMNRAEKQQHGSLSHLNFKVCNYRKLLKVSSICVSV